MDIEMATANAWAFLRFIDPRYKGDLLEDLSPERVEHVRSLADLLINTDRKGVLRGLEWAMDKSGAIVHAEIVQMERAIRGAS